MVLGPRPKLHRLGGQEPNAEFLLRPHPAETQQHQRKLDVHDIGKQHPDCNVWIRFGRNQRGFHNARQLQTQQQEHHAVPHKLEHSPGTVRAPTHRQPRAAHNAGAGDGGRGKSGVKKPGGGYALPGLHKSSNIVCRVSVSATRLFYSGTMPSFVRNQRGAFSVSL